MNTNNPFYKITVYRDDYRGEGTVEENYDRVREGNLEAFIKTFSVSLPDIKFKIEKLTDTEYWESKQ